MWPIERCRSAQQYSLTGYAHFQIRCQLLWVGSVEIFELARLTEQDAN